MTTRDDHWLAVLDASGSPYTVHRHAAHTVAERQALPFFWSRPVKTLAFTTPDTPLLLVALRAEDRADFTRVAAAAGTSRSQLRPADAGLLLAESLTRYRHRQPPSRRVLPHGPAVTNGDQPVVCGAGTAEEPGDPPGHAGSPAPRPRRPCPPATASAPRR